MNRLIYIDSTASDEGFWYVEWLIFGWLLYSNHIKMNINKITVFDFKNCVVLYSAQWYHNLITSCIEGYLQNVLYDKLFSNVFPFLFLCAGIPCLNVMIDIKHYTAIAWMKTV